MSAAVLFEPLSIDAALAEMGALLDQLVASELPRTDTELADAVEGLAAVQARLGEFQLRLARAAEQSRVAERAGASGADAWLAHLTGTSRGRMAGGLWLARM